MRRVVTTLVLICGGVLMVPAIVVAQAGISGTVQDASGAVLPGVTVEASSPALIEKARTAVTDGVGAYSIVDLRPGTYTVSFTLPGFSIVKREGIVLQGAFTALVNAELRLGALEETVIVSGASPVVDVKSTLEQTVLTKQEIETLPGARTLKGRAALIPGVIVPSANTGVVAHGSDSSDSNTMVDGFKAGQHMVGRGTGQLGVGSVTQTQEAAIEELVYDTGAQGAEYAMSGVRMNIIPKEGGNRFVAEGVAYGSNKRFESDNLSQSVKAQGLEYSPQLFFYDYNPTAGGPIRKDKLWYFGSISGNNQNSYVLDTFFNPNEPSTPANCRTPTSHCQADTGAYLNTSETIRITDQITPRNKLRFSFDNTKYVSVRGNFGNGVQPEASWYLPLYPTYVAQLKWSAPVTNRLLFEAGYSYERGDFDVDFQPANPPTAITRWDLGTGIVSENQYISYTYQQRLQEAKASAAYVTGSHSIKVGFEDRFGNAIQTDPYHGDMSIRYVLNGAPVSVVVQNGAAANTQQIRFNGGAYAQDQWKLRRVTINVGLRWDHFNAGVPAESAPASYWTPAVSVPEISNVPNWNNFSPRLGGAWDVSGDGKTAVKASVGRYVAAHALDITAATNPLYSVGDTRSWTDLNHDGTVINPDGTPQYSEIGASKNPLFGTLLGTTRLDPNMVRDKNWSYEGTVQRELWPRVSVGASYYRRRYYDLPWTNNIDVTFADYTPFVYTAPLDPRLPNGGGEQITLYNLNPAKFGQVQNVMSTSTNFRVYNGFEVTANVPLPKNGFIFTSLTDGKTEVNTCQVSDPNNLRFCDQKGPFRQIYKLSGGLPLPFDMMISGNFQVYDTPGSGLALTAPYVAANYTVTSARAGIPITNTSIAVNLVPPNTLWEDRYKSLDARFSKRFSMGRAKVTALAEFANLFDLASVELVNQAYGANWLRPQAIERGRNVRFGLQVRF